MARHSLDLLGQDGSRILEPIENLTPEDAFRKSLALDTFQAAFDRLKAIWEARGEREKFGHLQAYLAEECRGSKARNLADKLEVSESRARCLVSELRRQFGGILREQVAQLLSDPTPADIDAELDWLWEALSL